MPLAITPTSRPWTHTSDDSYFYQLSLVLATATVSLLIILSFTTNCKIVLLTLVTPRGVTDLYLSWGIHIEHARMAYHETCGTEYQKPYRRRNSQTPYFNWNIAQARPLRVSDVSRSLQSWVSTTHRSYSQLTSFKILWGLYSISAQNGYEKPSCWPWQHPGESPTYVLHMDET